MIRAFGLIVVGSSAQYPRDNGFVRSWAQVKFEDLSEGRRRLAEGSPFRRAGLDGTDAASTTTCSERPSVKEAMAADRAGQRLP